MLTDEKMLRWKQTPKGGYLQRSQFLLHFVQKPTHKGGDLGQWKSIRRAVTSKSKGLEPKSKFRAFPLTKRLGNLGKNTPSITKLFQCTPSQQNRAQKQEGFHKGRITVKSLVKFLFPYLVPNLKGRNLHNLFYGLLKKYVCVLFNVYSCWCLSFCFLRIFSSYACCYWRLFGNFYLPLTFFKE